MAMNIHAPVQILRYNVPEGTTASAFVSYIKETITPGALIIAAGRVIDDKPRSLDDARENYIPVHGLFIGTENPFVPFVVVPIAGPDESNGICFSLAPFVSDVFNGDGDYRSSLRNRGYLGNITRNTDTSQHTGIYRPANASTLPEEVTNRDDVVFLHYGDTYPYYQILLYFDVTLPNDSRSVKIYTRVSYAFTPSGPEDWSPWRPLGGSSLTAGDGISITDDAVAVDDTVVRTEGNQIIEGTLQLAAVSSVAEPILVVRHSRGKLRTEVNDSEILFRGGDDSKNYVRLDYGGTSGAMPETTDGTLAVYNSPTGSFAFLSVIAGEKGEYAIAPSTRSTPVSNEIITYDFLSTKYLPISGCTLTGGLFGTSVALSESIIDVSLGSCFTKIITAATTFAFTGVPSNATARFSLVLTNGGSQTVTWPSSVKWSGGANPELAASGVDVFTFFTADGGTTWYGVHSVQGAA